MLVRCNGAFATLDGLQGRFCYAATTAKDFKLRFLCDYDNAITIVLQPKYWSCADAALVLRFETAFVLIGDESEFSFNWPPTFEQDEYYHKSSNYDQPGSHELTS